MTPITTDTRSGRPLWADRETLLFEQMRGGSAAVYSQRADGTGHATPMWTPGAGGWTYAPNALLPDRRLVVSRARLGSYGIYREQDLLLATPGNAAATPLLASTDNEANGVVSPNGEWIAYRVGSNRTLRGVGRALSSDDRSATRVHDRWRVSGLVDRWQAVVLHVERWPTGIRSPSVLTTGTGTVSTPRLRIQGDYMPPLWGYRRFDVMPDGNQFVLLKPAVDNRGILLKPSLWKAGLMS